MALLDFLDPEKSAFGSGLRWLDRLGQANRNVLRGEFGSAGRQVVDFLSEIPDALLPGDMIPNVTRPEDYVETSELLGMENAPWYAKLPVDIIGGIVTDPLSWITLGGAGAATNLTKAGAKAGLRAAAVASKGGKVARVLDEVADVAKAAQKASLATKLSADGARKILQRNLSRAGRKNLGESIKTIDNMVLGASDDAGISVERLVAEVSDNPLFEQGGIKYFGKQVIKPGAIAAAVNKVPGAKKIKDLVAPPMSKIAHGMSRAFGWQVPETDVGIAIEKAVNDGYMASRVGSEEMTKIYSGVSDVEDKIIAHILQPGKKGVLFDKDGSVVRQLTGKTKLDQLDEFLSARPDLVDIVDRDKMANIMSSRSAVVGRWGLEATEAHALRPPIVDVPSGGKHLHVPATMNDRLDPDYMARHFKDVGSEEADDFADSLGKKLGQAPNFVKARTLSDDDVFKLLKDGKVTLSGAAESDLARASEQGKAIARGSMLRSVLGGDSYLADPGIKRTMDNTIAAIANSGDRSTADIISNIMSGMPPRNMVLGLLAKTNRIFKPAAVYGLFVPRVNAITRNKVGGIFQALSTQELKTSTQLKRVGNDLWGAVADGWQKATGSELPADRITQLLRESDDAFSSSGGSLSQLKKNLSKIKIEGLPNNIALEAYENGVLDTFVRSEDLLKGLSRSAKIKKMVDLMDVPGAMFQGLESRMRLASFADLRSGGYSSLSSGDIIREAFLDYRTTNAANRTLRDIIPFAAFTTGSIRQQGKYLSRTPAAAIGLAQLSGSPEEPVLPWIGEQSSYKIGEEGGDSQYVTSFGLPSEALNMIPTSGRDFERGVVASSHPLLKTAYGAVTGREPYFGTQYGSYDKTPEVLTWLGAGDRSETGRKYRQLAGTGLIQPIETIFQLVDRIADDRKSSPQRVLNLLTGVRVASNDRDLATRQILEEKIRNDPRIRQYIGYFSDQDNEELNDLLDSLQEVRKKMREEKAAARVEL